jgi:hypothetical protein
MTDLGNGLQMITAHQGNGSVLGVQTIAKSDIQLKTTVMLSLA